MPKFIAPEGMTAITLSMGEIYAVDGMFEIHTPSAEDVTALAAAGCTLVAQGAYFALPVEAPAIEPDPS